MPGGGELRWRDVVPRWWLLVFALVVLASHVNEIPSLIGGYDTTENWGSFVSKTVLSGFRALLFTATGMWLLLVVADPLYRAQLPQHPSFRRAFGAAALDDPRSLRALGLGIVFAAVSLAYVTLFYLVSQHFGAWAPVEIDYAKALSGWLPWAEPLQTGIMAAFGEELLFRVIGVLLYLKLVRWRPAALLLAAATWAFLHSNYAQMPGYLRGVELSIVGVLWGALLCRFGILTTLTAHYLYDCWLGSFVVFQSPAWSDKIGAVVISIWPLALFGWGLWRCARRRGEVELWGEEISQAVALPEPADAHTPAPRWNLAPIHVAARWRWKILVASLALAGLAALLPLPQAPMRAHGGLDRSRAQIAAMADEILRARGVAPEHFRRLITVSRGWVPATYLLEQKSLAEVARLFQTEVPDLAWTVRYFQVEEREEFSLSLDKHGALLSWGHTVPREAAGASMERNAALALAKEQAAREYHVDFSQETLISEYTTPQTNRLDHAFTFERTGWAWGDAKLRTRLEVQGNESVNFSHWIKIPEAWELARSKTGWRKFLVQELNTWLTLGKGIVIGFLFVLLLRKHLIPWRIGFLFALAPAAIFLVERLNQLPWLYASYATTTPLTYFLFTTWGSDAVGLVMNYLGEAFSLSLTLGLLAWAFGWRLSDAMLWPAQTGERRRFWANAATLLLASLALLWLKNAAQQCATGWWLPERAVFVDLPAVNASAPWLLAVTKSFDAAWQGTLSIAIMASVAALLWRRYPRLTIAILVIQPLLTAGSADSFGAFVHDLITGELQWLFTMGLLIFLWRGNPVLIFLYHFLATLMASTLPFLSHGGPVYQCRRFRSSLYYWPPSLPRCSSIAGMQPSIPHCASP